MSRVFRNVLDAFKTAVIATPVTTDTGAPAHFREEKNAKIERSQLDRGFVIETSGGNDLNYVNLPGKMTGTMKFKVRVSYINEGRSETDAGALIAEDGERLQQFVETTVHDAGIGGLLYVSSDGPVTIDEMPEGTRKVLNVPFTTNYYDDAVTS